MRPDFLIPEEFIEYLEASGLQRTDSFDPNTITIGDRDKAVEFKQDKATFYVFFDGGGQETSEFKPYGSADGISQLDIFKFMLLMHCYGIVPLQQMVSMAREEKRKDDLFWSAIRSCFPYPLQKAH